MDETLVGWMKKNLLHGQFGGDQVAMWGGGHAHSLIS
jgi:hypothetical protein